MLNRSASATQEAAFAKQIGLALARARMDGEMTQGQVTEALGGKYGNDQPI